jgi:putative transposase
VANEKKPAPRLALPDRPSIAVLPFVNMRGDPEQEYFADGITEDLITGKKVYRSRDAARADVFDYIERFYNPVRRHSTIGYLSPLKLERKVALA